MANLNDLKKFGDQVLPVLKDLFPKTAAGKDKPNRQSEEATIRTLQKLVAEASSSTPASLAQRVDAIVSVRQALTDILVQAAANNVALKETTVRTIQTQRNALRNKFGLLLERETFSPIAKLLSKGEIKSISQRLKGAQDEIAKRMKAKQTLDTIVKAVILAGRIAAVVA